MRRFYRSEKNCRIPKLTLKFLVLPRIWVRERKEREKDKLKEREKKWKEERRKENDK